jgi:hypothetical protein
MTVPAVGFSGPTFVQTPGNGVATNYSFPFLITAATDLAVGFIISGAYTLQTTGFTVNAIYPGSGQVVFTIPPPIGTTVDLRSIIPEAQLTNFSNLGSYYPESTTNAVDRAVRNIADLYRLTYQFGIHGPDQEATPWPALPPPSGRLGMGLVFDSVFGLPAVGALTTVPVTSALVGSFIYPPLGVEGSSVVNITVPYGNVLRYGANSVPGTTDMTAAFNNALASVGRAYAPSWGGPYLVAGQIVLSAGCTLYGDGSSSVINFSSTANTDFIVASNLTGVTVSDLKLVATGITTSNNYQGVLAFRGCTNCRAERLDISGFYADGINLTACVDCYVQDNYFHNGNQTLGGGCDVHVNSTTAASSLNCIVADNRCFGGGDFGIGLYQTNTTGFPVQKCRVSGNRVGQNFGYGILLYDVVAAGVDCWNHVDGNYVENIQGIGIGGNTNYGCGIYVANQGGCSVTNNTVRNCCVTTTGAALTPAGIGINSQAQLSACTITGNTILDMAQGNASGINICGIFVLLCAKGVTITGNTISQQVAGGLQTGIYVFAPSNDITISGNTINILNSIASTRGIFCYASGANLSNLTINGNTVIGSASCGIEVFNNGAFTITNCSITGNTVSGGAAACVGLLVGELVQSSITANIVTCAGAVALNMGNPCTQTRISANSFITTGAVANTSGGANTGSIIDESNYFSSSNGTGANAIQNTGTGLNVRQLGSATPTAGNSVTGDVIYNTVGATPFAWLCTTSGVNPGTAVWTGLTMP